VLRTDSLCARPVPLASLQEAGARAGQESLMVGSWCPPNSEVHGLALHGLAVRSFFEFQW